LTEEYAIEIGARLECPGIGRRFTSHVFKVRRSFISRYQAQEGGRRTIFRNTGYRLKNFRTSTRNIVGMIEVYRGISSRQLRKSHKSAHRLERKIAQSC